MLHFMRKGSGPMLVMLHGFLGGSRYWAPQFDAFASDFDIIVPDLPGFAGSRNEPVQHTIEGLAGAVLELLDQLGVSRFHLLGHSMGGMLALQIALENADRVKSLVLYGTNASGDLPGRFESLEVSIKRIEDEGIAACAQRIVPTWFVQGMDAPYCAMCVQAGSQASAAAAIAALQGIAKWNVRGRTKEIKMPTLVICGDRDRSVEPQQAFELSLAIANSKLCIAPGCAHNVHLEAPALFNLVLGDFLRIGTEGRAAGQHNARSASASASDNSTLTRHRQ